MSEDDTNSLGTLLAEALFQRAVGVYSKSLSARAPCFIGISKKRYDEVIRPEIERLVTELEKLKSQQCSKP